MRTMLLGTVLFLGACERDPGTDESSTDTAADTTADTTADTAEPCVLVPPTLREPAGEDLTGLEVEEQLEFARCNEGWGTLRQWAEATDGSGVLCEGVAAWQIVEASGCAGCDAAWTVAFGPLEVVGSDCEAAFGEMPDDAEVPYDWLGVRFDSPTVFLDGDQNEYDSPLEVEMDEADGTAEAFRFVETVTYTL